MSGNHNLFETLEAHRTPLRHWLISLAINVGMVIALAFIPVAATRSIIQNQTHEIPLIYPKVNPPAAKIEPPKPKIGPLPKLKAPPMVVSKIPPPVVQPKPKEIEAPKIEAPKLQTARVPEPKFEIPAPPAPTPIKPSVKTDVFAGATPAPSGPKPQDRSVKLGGFGDPNGVPASDKSTGKGLVVARVGSFDLPQADGNGGGGGHSSHVAMAGFGDAGYDSPGGSTRGAQGRAGTVVKPAGFNDYRTEAPKTREIRNAAPAETPVEITYKPRPVYTPQAREKRLEGEVQVEVIFTSTGQVHVLRVIRGLGYGLDESARTAAEQIRFRPGTREGVAVDMRGVVHITFELS